MRDHVTAVIYPPQRRDGEPPTAVIHLQPKELERMLTRCITNGVVLGGLGLSVILGAFSIGLGLFFAIVR
jgi:hypothetical protein